MKLSFKLFIVISTVAGTVSILGQPPPEPCSLGNVLEQSSQGFANNGYGKYDMTACNICAESGKGHGTCCDSIYRHSLGRDDDDYFQNENFGVDCYDINEVCVVGQADCYPGLFCNAEAKNTCQLKEDDPNACIGGGCASLMRSSTGTMTKGGPSFVLVVVGLLGVAMMALQVALQRRHRGAGLLRRHHYSEVEATATRIDV